MADYSRRNRGSSGSNYDDFDWDRFDRETSQKREENTDSSEPLRRRRQSESSRRSSQSTATRRTGSAATNNSKGSKKRRRRRQLTEKQLLVRRRIRLVVFVAIMIIVVICAGMFVGMYAAVSREIKDMNISSLALNYNSTIYYTDQYGNAQELEKINSDQNRIWVDSAMISPTFKDAIVSIEDERFYKHSGVDIKRTLGATVKYIAAKMGIGESSYGGSTITQQVIKNITQDKDFKATRKIKEMMRAIALEHQLSKDEILTMYCNIVYFANGCNGVEAASRTYFNKSASELTIPEAASIAGITQFPSEYDPIAHPEKNTEKRNTVIKKMYELGKISENEYNSAMSTPLMLSSAGRSRNTQITSYFVDQVISDVINDLINQKGYSEEFATSQVYNGGLKIYATIDTTVQSIMEEVFENRSNFPYSGQAQSAMVITDPYTGQIKGIIGGLGEKTDIRGFNRATQAVRQPGSSIKPLSVYGPAVDMGDITEVDIVCDEEITIGYDNWKPKNSYSGFKGDMTIKEAVARSANIPAVKVLDAVGISNSFGYLQNKFHISTLNEGDKNYSSLALGGLTKGVTVKDMAAAYGVFVNRGRYITPYTYTRVLDSTDNVILENYVNESQAMSESAAYITADLLSGPVNLQYGTATSAKLSSGMPAYGKTGTTDQNFDKWFVGFTPYYVGACWFGFDTPSNLSAAGISGNPCVKAWKLVFDRISAGQPHKELETPAAVVEASVCSISGQLANNTCTAVKAYFISGTQPKKYCTNHRNVKESSALEKATTAPAATETSGGAASGGNNENAESAQQPAGGGSTSQQHSSGTAQSGGTAQSSGSHQSGSSTQSSGTSQSGTSSSGSAAAPQTGGASAPQTGGGAAENAGGGESAIESE